jgi:hypothetical protein
LTGFPGVILTPPLAFFWKAAAMNGGVGIFVPNVEQYNIQNRGDDKDVDIRFRKAKGAGK